MLVIISDVHDNLANLDKVIAWANSNQAEAILECGDLTNSDTLHHLAQAWTKPLYVLQGNIDFYDISELKKYPQIINLGRAGGVFNYGNKKIGACHEPNLLAGLLSHKPEIVFYGHTHQPWEEIKHGIHFVNPGNVSNTRHAPTFATYSPAENKLELVLINDLPNI
jgi:hypothetical protein